MIHVDDLADAFLRIAESGPICKNLIFDVSNDASESVDDILEAVVRVSGASGYKYREPQNCKLASNISTNLENHDLNNLRPISV